MPQRLTGWFVELDNLPFIGPVRVGQHAVGHRLAHFTLHFVIRDTTTVRGKPRAVATLFWLGCEKPFMLPCQCVRPRDEHLV